MTEMQLAKQFGIEDEAEVGYNNFLLLDPRFVNYVLGLHQRILDLQHDLDTQQREEYVFVDDDEDEEYVFVDGEDDAVVELEEPKAIYTSLAASPYRGFVSRWRERCKETGNAIPMNIHPKVYERENRKIDELLGFALKEGA